MYPHGIVYQAGKSKSHSEFVLRPKLLIRLAYHFFRTFGFGLASFAICGIIFTFYPILKEEFTYLLKPKELGSGFEEIMLEASAQKLGLNSYFSLNISKIGAKANIVSNVDAGNFNEYSKALKEGIAHAKGTNFPGQEKLVYLFSHSTDSPLNFSRYNAIFYLLGRLEKGDIISVYFLNQEYKYQVSQKIITSAGDTSWLRDKGQGEMLILQTCDPPGTSLRRLLVMACYLTFELSPLI